MKIPQIDNGIDSDLFCKFKKPIIGYAGCSSANKNWEKIKEACDNLGLEFRAAFRGKNQIPHRKMVNFYLGLDVYVLASLTEAFNNTVLEALSCNIPVIMTKTGAWKKFKGYVEFIDPTYESIYCALKKYAGRKLILEKFLWKKIMTKYRRIYETVYEKNAGR